VDEARAREVLHVINKRGEPVDSPSPFAQASLDADIHAFTAFMKHLKIADPERTVLMVQVENETGTWGLCAITRRRRRSSLPLLCPPMF